MDLIIPTAGRWQKQTTLEALLYAGLTPTLVVQDKEVDKSLEHWRGVPAKLAPLPSHITTIAPTREWILHNVGSDSTFCMLDDDLVFYRRRTDDPTKLTDILPEELEKAFWEMENMLRVEAPHIGFAAREGANRNIEPWLWNTRIMRVLGYNRDTLRRENIHFDRLPVMEDFDVALQLLEKGYANCVLNRYAHNQAGSGAAGGCSTFRTPAMQAMAAHELARLHPGFVKVVEKTTKGAWGGGTRTDVNIQWKKAYASSKYNS